MKRRHFIAGTAAAGLVATVPAKATASPLTELLRSSVDASPIAAVGAVSKGGGDAVAVGGFVGAAGRPTRESDIFRIGSVTKPVTSVAAMILVEEGLLDLNEPVDAWLPEVADRRVLRHIGSPLSDTVPANRPITLRDLLTNTFGLGAIMDWPPSKPIHITMIERQLAPDFALFSQSADAFMARIAELPLAAQPGEQFLYHTGMELAGVLIARATGRSLGAVFAEEIFDPLGMADTAFFVPPDKRERLTGLYGTDHATGELAAVGAPWTDFATAPRFESGAAGLVSTAPDLLKFAKMLGNGGILEGHRILSTQAVDLLMRDHLTAEQRSTTNAVAVLGQHAGWGLGGSVEHGGGAFGLPAGAYGWNGAYGTSLYVDRASGLAGVLLTNRLMDTPEPPPTFIGFWKAIFEA